MRYSYINPRKKSILTPEIILMLTFFTISLVMLIVTYLFLFARDYSFNVEYNEVINQRAVLNKNIVKMDAQILFIKEQKALSQKVHTQNIVLKDSIKNMFDLVPKRIILTQATLLENGLVFHGITPTKDIYNFMLQAPLRSIFHRTYTSFYPADRGWLRFVSTNYIDDGYVDISDANRGER